MKPAVFHPEASQEHADVIQYYVAINRELGERLDAEIRRLVSQIGHNPQRFLRLHSLARRALAHGFPYSIIYLEQPDHVWIVALMHAKRRPGYWKKRLA